MRWLAVLCVVTLDSPCDESCCRDPCLHGCRFRFASCCGFSQLLGGGCPALWDRSSVAQGYRLAGVPGVDWSKLPDGNQALGLMQINTIHLPALAKFGIRREDLFDACINQKVGAWILADCMRRFGQIWRAVGCYYAGPGSKNFSAQEKYVSGVRRYYEGYRCKSSPKGCACEGS